MPAPHPAVRAERDALIALAHCLEPGDARTGRLVARSGAVRALAGLRGGSADRQEGLRARLADFSLDDALAAAHAAGARIITRVDREWPTQLDDLGDQTPFALWAIGAADLRLLALRSVAVVGARACTPYGEEVARGWAADLAADRWTVLSGGAFGIDAAAHRGALAAGGATVCVLAGGVDVPYPRAHDALIARIADDGLVVSETPPGEPVRRQRFLSRNRVIAALCRATLVVEAAERSGTTATARSAAALNRIVMAVPGPVTSPASAGCHRMIRDGEAILVSTAADVMDLLDLERAARARAPGGASARDRLGDRERLLLDAFPRRGTADLERLVLGSGLATADAAAALGLLEADGWVLGDGRGWRLVRLE